MATTKLDEKPRAKQTSRLRWLVAAHVVLATVYAWTPLIPRQFPRVPGYGSMIWAAVGASSAPMVLLAFWCALGTSSRARRQIGGIVGVAYLAACSVLHAFMYDSTLPNILPSMSGDARHYSSAYGERFISAAGVTAVFVCIFAGVLLWSRRWLGELRYVEQPGDSVSVARGRYQYSLRHLVAATTLTALVCGLSRGASVRSEWQGRAQQGVFVVAFVAFVLVGAWAALTPGPIRGRLWRAIILCVLVSWTYTFTSSTAGFDFAWWLKAWWWILLNSLVLMGLPAAIIIASLLVVRSCGYRLVPPQR